MKHIAVFISNAGTGTNLKAIADAVERSIIQGKIAVVVSDAPDAFGLEAAKQYHIPTIIMPSYQNLKNLLRKTYAIGYIALAGWKKIIPNSFIDAFPCNILNIHPGLIPDVFGGTVKNPDGTDGLWNRGKFTTAAIKNFIDSKATYAGSSLHFLSKEFDFGPVLKRCFVQILASDTVETLYARLKKEENKMYVEVLAQLCN